MLNDSLILLRQELLVTVMIFILLFIKVGSKEWSNHSILILINVLLLINFIAGFYPCKDGNLFNGMFRSMPVYTFEKNILNLATFLISLNSFTWLKKHEHMPEFYMLLLSTLLGMFFMISSGNLLMFYLSLELSTIPLAALANFELQKKQSSEAAFKLIISSAFSSALLLFGISLIYGSTGTISFLELPELLNGSSLQTFSFVLLLAGFAFKISAVPFHLWTADVYEGAPVAVTSYLSVASKGAFIFVFTSVLYTVFKPLSETWYSMLALLAIMTIIIGNLFAIRQENLKRFLAFSSIAQVGFLLVGISASSQAGNASVIYFILIYLFSNLAAFGVILLVSQQTGKERIVDYKAFYKTNPFLSWILTIALFSLAGVPPTAGFFGKFFLLIAGAAKGNYWLISVAALNMIISFYYYLRIVKAIFMDENAQPLEKISVPLLPRTGLLLCLAGIILSGAAGNIYDYIYSICKAF